MAVLDRFMQGVNYSMEKGQELRDNIEKKNMIKAQWQAQQDAQKREVMGQQLQSYLKLTQDPRYHEIYDDAQIGEHQAAIDGLSAELGVPKIIIQDNTEKFVLARMHDDLISIQGLRGKKWQQALDVLKTGWETDFSKYWNKKLIQINAMKNVPPPAPVDANGNPLPAAAQTEQQAATPAPVPAQTVETGQVGFQARAQNPAEGNNLQPPTLVDQKQTKEAEPPPMSAGVSPQAQAEIQKIAPAYSIHDITSMMADPYRPANLMTQEQFFAGKGKNWFTEPVGNKEQFVKDAIAEDWFTPQEGAEYLAKSSITPEAIMRQEEKSAALEAEKAQGEAVLKEKEAQSKKEYYQWQQEFRRKLRIDKSEEADKYNKIQIDKARLSLQKRSIDIDEKKYNLDRDKWLTEIETGTGAEKDWRTKTLSNERAAVLSKIGLSANDMKTAGDFDDSENVYNILRSKDLPRRRADGTKMPASAAGKYIQRGTIEGQKDVMIVSPEAKKLLNEWKTILPYNSYDYGEADAKKSEVYAILDSLGNDTNAQLARLKKAGMNASEASRYLARYNFYKKLEK
jgi:hypothetical protein